MGFRLLWRSFKAVIKETFLCDCSRVGPDSRFVDNAETKDDASIRCVLVRGAMKQGGWDQQRPTEVGWWRSGRLRGWGSQTGRGRWSRWWDCSVTMPQSANRPCLTGRGQPLTAPNYTSSVLQKAANVACPFKNTSWPQPRSDSSDVYGGIWPTYSSTAIPLASFLSFKVLRFGVKPGRGLDI